MKTTLTLLAAMLISTLMPACGGASADDAPQATATPDPRTTGIVITCRPKPDRI